MMDKSFLTIREEKFRKKRQILTSNNPFFYKVHSDYLCLIVLF